MTEQDWREILWREWRDCEDTEYAERLYQTIYVDWESSHGFDNLALERQPRPFMGEVEIALSQACLVSPGAKAMWQHQLDHLDQVKAKPLSLENLITDLEGHPRDRFIARHGLLYWGGQGVEALAHLVMTTAGPLQQTVYWLLASIEYDTTQRLAQRVADILCPQCLTRLGPHQLDLGYQSIVTFYGCRTCKRSRELLEGINHVVAVLDATLTVEQSQQGDTLRVSWLTYHTLFDFDHIEIIQASDEEVERFVVQVGNDTDPVRKPCYQQISCVMGPECRLSENTLRILERMFGGTVQGNI